MDEREGADQGDRHRVRLYRNRALWTTSSCVGSPWRGPEPSPGPGLSLAMGGFTLLGQKTYQIRMTLGEAGRSDWRSEIHSSRARCDPWPASVGLHFLNPTYGSSPSSWMGCNCANTPMSVPFGGARSRVNGARERWPGPFRGRSRRRQRSGGAIAARSASVAFRSTARPVASTTTP